MEPLEIAELLGNARTDLAAGRFEPAAAACRQVLAIRPDEPQALHLLGVLHDQRGRADLALPLLERAAALAPSDADVLGNYGIVLSQAGRSQAGIAALRRALALAPQHPTVLMQLAEALWQARAFDEAHEHAARAAELLPQDAQAALLLANTLQMLARFEDALREYRRAQELAPDSLEAAGNLAVTQLKLGATKESLLAFDRIMARWPESHPVRLNRALALLTLGELELGFTEYEHRLAGSAEQFLGRPRWDGSDPSNKRILLAAEQGAGDVIQFLRYATLIAARGAEVWVTCSQELHPVAVTVDGVRRVFPPTAAMPPFDAYLPLPSSPRVFRTALHSIPADVPYVLANPALTERWRARLSSNRMSVGVVWAGAPEHLNDRARSCRLQDLDPLARVPGVEFYSLQKGIEGRRLAHREGGAWLIDVSQELHDYGDTAALVNCLDLVISVDTSIVHLAGALARPVWTLLARGADWRWLLERDDTPWYPTMRLFRQERAGDWDSVLQRVARELGSLVTRRQAPAQ